MDQPLARLFSPAQTPDDMAREIVRLNAALDHANFTIRAVCDALKVPMEPAHTLRQRLLAQVEGMDERVDALEQQFGTIITRQQEELWQRRAELHAALRPRSRWVHFMRVLFPPKPGNLDHLLQKGL